MGAVTHKNFIKWKPERYKSVDVRGEVSCSADAQKEVGALHERCGSAAISQVRTQKKTRKMKMMSEDAQFYFYPVNYEIAQKMNLPKRFVLRFNYEKRMHRKNCQLGAFKNQNFIENMCREGNTIGGDFDFTELKAIINLGINLASEEGYQSMMSDFDSIIGFKYLKWLHFNDSKDIAFGTRVKFF
uniref:Uncharacterized protein n=1 Tax=Strigamia maritima TaxID=126957 RepID=T1IRQ7_STRMM